MAYKIIVKKRFTNKAVKLLHFLENHWNTIVANDFLEKLDNRIHNLSLQLFTGVPIKELSDVRPVLITKHNRLYYRIHNKAIRIINLYDTKMNPKKHLHKRK
jgi:plasmid stabilization system protein ParE